MMLQAGDDLVRDRDRDKMSPRHKVGLAAGEGLCHLPGHGGWDHRLQELAEIFAVAVAGFAILDNHLHLLVRLDPEVARGWSDA